MFSFWDESRRDWSFLSFPEDVRRVSDGEGLVVAMWR